MNSLTVIIPTFRRHRSLQRTLESLLRAERSGIDLEIIVVDNAVDEPTRSVVEGFSNRLPLRYLTEEKPAKSNALNRAIRWADLKELVAVIDDDITVDPGWFQGVIAISNRWPEAGFYTGRTLVAFPQEDVPSWARKKTLLWGWAFSALDYGDEEGCFHPHQWAVGGHFWFRTEVLPDGYDFAEYDDPAGEPVFMLRLQQLGYGGVYASDAVAWHHIQPELLELESLRKRAYRIGRFLVSSRVIALGDATAKIRRLRKHPLAGYVFCGLAAAASRILYFACRMVSFRDDMLLKSYELLLRVGAYDQYLAYLSDALLRKSGPLGRRDHAN